MKVVLVCQPDEGTKLDVLIAYSTVCPLLGEGTASTITIVLPIDDVPVGAFTAAPVALFTVKPTLSEAEMLFDPDTVIVAAYVPVLRPVVGTTVNESVSPADMLLIDVADNVNLFALVPDNATASSPVA